MRKVPVGGGQAGGACEARGSAGSRRSGSESCDTSRALDSCLRSAGRLGHSDRLVPAGRGSPAGVSSSAFPGHGRPDGVPLTAGEAVARCGTGICGAARSGVDGTGDDTGTVRVAGALGAAGFAAGDSAAACADTG